MRHLFTLLLLATTLIAGQVNAKSSVWKVSNEQNTLYLGGTIHVLSESDYPLPAEFEQAYKQAETLVFETDITGLEQPAVQFKLLEAMTYQDGNTLKTELSEPTYQQLSEFLTERGLPAGNFDRFTPAGVSLTLTILELQRLGLGVGAGVDDYYTKAAQADSKTIEALESIEEQLSFIAEMNNADANKMLMSTLNDLDNLQNLWDTMLDAWRSGEMSELEKLALQPMRSDYPKITKLLVDQRNNNWMKQIPAMLDDADVEFVLVGSLHMVGETGLLNQLEKLGYKVEQVESSQ